ncbi:MAG: translation elongation factor Ts [Deltaproteobacteria bacterium]|nr:translation elongation factor Ts [Deltaproteobacteria bacterium]
MATTITAAMVKQLRERTGAGMSDCKNALIEADGDFDKSAEILAVKLRGKVENRSGRIAAQGSVLTAISEDKKSGVIVEVNCQTDFVARGDGFKAFAESAVKAALASGAADIAALEAVMVDGKSLKETADELTGKSGEKHAIRRVARLTSSGLIASYVHFNSQIAVLVAVEGGSAAAVADEVTLQAASMKPLYLQRSEVSDEVKAKQRELFAMQIKAEEDDAVAEVEAWKKRMAEEADNVTEAVEKVLADLEKKAKGLQARPQQAKDKILEGKINKWFTDVVLLEQPSVKETKKSVADIIADLDKTAKVTHCVRFEVGEGVEKAEVKDFAAEVAEMEAKAAKG